MVSSAEVAFVGAAADADMVFVRERRRVRLPLRLMSCALVRAGGDRCLSVVDALAEAWSLAVGMGGTGTFSLGASVARVVRVAAVTPVLSTARPRWSSRRQCRSSAVAGAGAGTGLRRCESPGAVSDVGGAGIGGSVEFGGRAPVDTVANAGVCLCGSCFSTARVFAIVDCVVCSCAGPCACVFWVACLRGLRGCTVITLHASPLRPHPAG